MTFQVLFFLERSSFPSMPLQEHYLKSRSRRCSPRVCKRRGRRRCSSQPQINRRHAAPHNPF